MIMNDSSKMGKRYRDPGQMGILEVLDDNIKRSRQKKGARGTQMDWVPKQKDPGGVVRDLPYNLPWGGGPYVRFS